MQRHRFSSFLRWSSCAALVTLGLFSGSAFAEALQEKVRELDRLVMDGLTKQKQQANAPVTDEVFVRRIYLDVIGRIPTLKETVAFLEDPATDKRARLIEQLLNSDGYVQHFANYWSDILRVKSQLTQGNSQAAGAAYANWLREALKTNKPYDQLVRELVSASGKTYENGAVGFYIRDYNMPLDNMAVTTQVFLGTSMVCAQCHNHPFDKWTQMDYYQMAAHSYGMTGSNGLSNPMLADAFYGNRRNRNAAKQALPEGMERSDMRRAVSEILRPLRYNTVIDRSGRQKLQLPHDYQYSDADPKQAVEPVIPASFSKDGKIVQEGQPPIEAYASWMTSKDNPRFTTVIANRLWKKAFGKGVIEPVDEITDSTVPANPQLMSFLEATMKELNYDMKAYLSLIFNSASYQRAASTKDVELGEVYYFPGPLLRRMTAEQIWDSMVALYKPNPDAPNVPSQVERDAYIRQVEWLDRSLNALTTEEMVEATAKVAKIQKQLASDVRQAQAKLEEAVKSKDEAAIREARKAAASQRRRLDDAAKEVVYTVGFKKFAELAREGKLQEQVADAEFAREIASVIHAKEGQDLTIEEALDVFSRQQRQRLEAKLKERLRRDAEALQVNKKQMNGLRAWERLRDTVMVRAADLRSPAPNGHFLREFGQSDRELVENANDEASVGQALMLLNGKTFNQLMNPYTVIARSLRQAKTAEQAIDTLYLSLFSRQATPEEQALLKPVVEADERGRGDALWTLLNTRQFYFIQ